MVIINVQKWELSIIFPIKGKKIWLKGEYIVRFAGEYERTLDSKNRIVLPPKIRNCFEDNTFVICCFPTENFIRVYRVSDWEELTDKYLFVDDGVDRTDLQRYIFRNTEYCELDAQNRFGISSKFIERTGIERDIMIAGIGRRAEIWAKDKYQHKLDEKMDDKMSTPF